MLLTPDHINYKSSRNFIFTRGRCVSRLHGCLGCFHSHISTRTFRRALTASVDSYAEIKECLFSGVTKTGRVWRKVPESGARSVEPSLQKSSGARKADDPIQTTNVISAVSPGANVEEDGIE